jgi:hypothetical protein
MADNGGSRPEEPGRQVVLQGAALLEAWDELCARRQTMYLATPYFAFESRFLERAGADLRVRATMGRSVLQNTLAQAGLRLRFPWGLTQLGGPTRILEYEEGPASRTLRIAAPLAMVRDDQRRATRLEGLGRSTGVLGSRDLTLVRCTLENLSTLGTGAYCLEPLPADGFQVGQSLDVSLSLEQGPDLTTTARVAHSAGQALGLAFHPPLAGADLERLVGWLQPRLDKAQRRWDDRALLRSQAERAVRARPAPEGVLVVSADPTLRARIEAALEEVPLRWVWPALAPYREVLDTHPPCVVLVVITGGMEESHRLRALLDAAPPQAPLLALGAGPDLDPARALAQELKAALFIDRKTLESPFFKRLVQGLIRKHWPEQGTPKA